VDTIIAHAGAILIIRGTKPLKMARIPFFWYISTIALTVQPEAFLGGSKITSKSFIYSNI
jgi:hypothetical protein